MTVAALDTFEWYTSSIAGSAPHLHTVIAEQRQYLYSLRSEDERQRYVEEAIEELRHLVKEYGSKARP
jgi:hypothetical protein